MTMRDVRVWATRTVAVLVPLLPAYCVWVVSKPETFWQRVFVMAAQAVIIFGFTCLYGWAWLEHHKKEKKT